jgi:mannose/fructose/N-acetylgalactosamine-specific phosphotransferase system component IIC
MLTGQKTKKWGIFPKPGVSDEDIQNVSESGALLKEKLRTGQEAQFQEELVARGGVVIPVSILFIESRAKMLFRIWANLITKKTANGGSRKFWVNFFKYYLIFALFIVSPIVLTIYHIFVRPFKGQHIKRELAYYRGTQLR